MAAVLPSATAAGGDKSHRLSAAADLIRNLDAALSGMNAAASSAAEDAARARRNARAAGEVARRYGATAGGGSGRRKKNASSGGGEGSNNLLERKRERRAAARMAAEAKQRRDHPIMNYSPRHSVGIVGASGLSTPIGSSRGVARGAFFVESSASPSAAGVSTSGALNEVVDNIRIEASNVAATPAAALKTTNIYDGNPATYSQSHNEMGESVQPGMYAAEILKDGIPIVKQGRSDSLAEYEDAMMDHHNGSSQEEGVFDDNEATSIVQDEQQQQQYQQPTEGQQGGAQAQGEGEQPTNDDYYYNLQQQGNYQQTPVDQQQQYQQQQQQMEGDGNQGYYNNQDPNQQYYYNQQQQQQPTSQPYADSSSEQPYQQETIDTPSLTIATSTSAAMMSNPSPKQQHFPPTPPPRSQPTSTNRIEASHAEDVLTLSLELERVRSQLASTTEQLTHATTTLTAIQSQNDHLQSQNEHLHGQLESHNERSSTQLLVVQEKLDGEHLRANAAEEDAALALELAKEAQVAKEECEMWLSRSLEEIDLWKGRCAEMEEQQLNQQQQGSEEGEEEQKKVRFKDDCPPSPVVSEEGGYDEDRGVSPPNVPPPPPPPPGGWSTPQSALRGNTSNDNDEVNDTPSNNIAGAATNSTPSKSAIASGRAFLHRTFPSPQKGMASSSSSGLSPHPRQQASELLKKSAETRRLLRERLTPGKHHGPKPPMGASKLMMPRVSSDPTLDLNNDSFASRQGAACKAVGRTIRESGARLKLHGTWWDNAPLLTNGNSSSGGGTKEIEGVAQLESMVKVYCGGVEGTIGKQQEKIDELLAFCDHLEKEVVSSAGK